MSEDHRHHGAPESRAALRTRAIESLLVEKGLIASDAVDAIVETYERDVGPMNGARVVARAWCDPEYRKRLLEDGTAAIAEMGFVGREGAQIVVLENTPASTTWWCAPCAPAIRGRCWASRQVGTNPSPTVPARSPSPARC